MCLTTYTYFVPLKWVRELDVSMYRLYVIDVWIQYNLKTYILMEIFIELSKNMVENFISSKVLTICCLFDRLYN